MIALSKKILRFLKKRADFWLVATATATTAALPFEPQIIGAATLLMLAIMCLQFLLGSYNDQYNKIHAVEWVVNGKVQTAGPYKKAVPWLSLLPIVHALYWPIAWLLLTIVVLWLAPPFFHLLLAYSKKDQLIDAQLAKVKAFQPLVAVHVSGRHNVAYQINQWLPVLEALDIPTIILARERNVIPTIAQTTLPIVHARNAAHVEAVVKQGIKTVLYPANPMKNVQVLRHHELNHFFINHGESDKVVNQNKLLMAYDKLLVAGPLAERRLRAAGLPIREGQIEHVGRPQAEMLLDKAIPGKTIQTLLYAPTWEGFVDEAHYSSVGPMAIDILQQLATVADCHLLFKPHPYTGLRLKHLKDILDQIKTLCATNGWEYIDPATSIHEAMNRSDLLITDISSVLNEYLVTGKPIILCINQQFCDVDLEEQFPSSAAAYKLFQGQQALASTLEQIRANDPLASKRNWVRGESLGRFQGSSLQRFKSVIQASIR